jgi:RNA-directed DNA polymerase
VVAFTVDRTSELTPQMRVGFGVIAERYSEYTNQLQSMIGHSLTASESWKSLPWKQFQKTLFRLQKRVYKAVRAGDKRKARSLQKLILKSQAAKLLAIRQVTQLNAGKRTAGIDGKASLTFEERFTMLGALEHHSNWNHQGLREIPIPKKDGTTRQLKIPTLMDRAWQCLAKELLRCSIRNPNRINILSLN